MKRIFVSGVAIAACFGLATTASAQYGSNHQYSSYGYANQEAQDAGGQLASPSDVVPTEAAPQDVLSTPAPAALGTTATTGPMYSAGGCDSGNCGGGCPGCGGSGCGLCGVGNGSYLNSGSRNIVFGIRGLVFDRSYEDDRGLGSNGSGQFLFSTDAEHDAMGGFEATLGVRNSSGSGWEVGYFGLFPDAADVTFTGVPLFSDLTAFSAVDLGGVAVSDAFNAATSWDVTRRTEIHNLEFNLLRNGGQTCGILGGGASIEWLAGFRWFRLRESMSLQANGIAAPFLTQYDTATDNNLYGLQLGARLNRGLSDRWSFGLGTKFGIYGNSIDAGQIIQDGNGNLATVPSGPVDYFLSSSKDEVSTMGELDFVLNYQCDACTRLNLGYRAIGITGIALSADQIPYNGNDTQEIQRIKSDGTLLLHGLYFGLERSF